MIIFAAAGFSLSRHDAAFFITFAADAAIYLLMLR